MTRVDAYNKAVAISNRLPVLAMVAGRDGNVDMQAAMEAWCDAVLAWEIYFRLTQTGEGDG